MPYQPNPARYDSAPAEFYRRCGRSGLLLPSISLGCWQNFGSPRSPASADRPAAAAPPPDEASFHENCRQMLFAAFDLGITHFDLANNYGPPPGAAEQRVGRILKQDLAAHRDELIIATKAGYGMWPGPYGNWGSRKHLLASLDASLRRLGLDYVDIFYSHRPDPLTPPEETLAALDQAVRSGKALYVGISNYSALETRDAVSTCRHDRLTLPVVHQPKYSMLHREPEIDVLPVADDLGLGVVCFSPLAQGLLSDKYLSGIPADSRAASAAYGLRTADVTAERLAVIRQLNDHARARGQSLAQMALAWALRLPHVTSLVIGASRPQQIKENLAALSAAPFDAAELSKIDAILRPLRYN